jgi:very-short-patch-repair endonuclease
MSKKSKPKKAIAYLTEESLAQELRHLYPGEQFIRDKTVPGSGIRKRPDYRCDNLKLIVEYDGPRHYRQAYRIKQDLRKRDCYEKMGFKVVRIPYFVQLTTETVQTLFGLVKEVHEDFPHGFIIKTVTLPADFCELGIELFKEDLARFQSIRTEIVQSLRNKVNDLGDFDLVLPRSLSYVLNDNA